MTPNTRIRKTRFTYRIFCICLMFLICILNTKQTQMESNPKEYMCAKQKGNVRGLLIPWKSNVTKIYY